MDEVTKTLLRRSLSRRRLLRDTGLATAAGTLALSGAGALASRGANAQAATPKGELTVSLPSEIVSLNPFAAQGAEESTRVTAQHIFDTLVVRDFASGEYVPSLATKWETPDPTTWSFTLRSDAKFHDGTAVTAKDVKASLEYLVQSKGPLAPLWAALDSVEAPDEQTVQIKTKTPLGTVLANLALLSVAPADRVAQDSFYTKPVGSGPFKVVSYKPQNELALAANTEYWGGAPGVQSLRFKDIPELAARVTALITGEIDFTYQLPPEQLDSLKGNKDLTIVSKPSYRYYFIWMNAETPEFKDKRVRQAMNYALDVKTMLDTLMQGLAEPMDAPIPSTIFGYAPQTPYTYDPKKAKELLSEAGVPNGFETNMIWNPGSAPQDREIAQAMFSYWNAVGVKVKDRQEERAQWLDDLLKLNWGMDFQTNGVVTGDADFVLRRLYTSSAHRTGYANPDLDKVLADAAATVDQKQRADLYAQACKILWDDAVGIYPFSLVQAFVSRKRVQGFEPTASFPVFTRVTVS